MLRYIIVNMFIQSQVKQDNREAYYLYGQQLTVEQTLMRGDSLVSHYAQTNAYAPCGSFTQPDPMATKYPWLSPYAYCAGDPINYVDPTGMDWVHIDYDEIDQYVFFDNVHSQADVDEMFGGASGYTYIGYGQTEVYDGLTIEFKSKEEVLVNGAAMDMGQDARTHTQGDGTMVKIHSTGKKGVNPETLLNNYFGSSYIGDRNPKTIGGEDSYAFVPKYESDRSAYYHDLAYDQYKTKGVMGALFDIRWGVVAADGALAYRNVKNIFCNDNPNDTWASKFVALAFVPLTSLKFSLSTTPFGIAFNLSIFFNH